VQRRMPPRHGWILPGAVLFLGAILAGAASAQSAPITLDVDHPAGIMRVRVQIPEVVAIDAANDEYRAQPAGRFQLLTLSGDPTTNADDNLPVVSDIVGFDDDFSAFTSKTIISVDGGDTAVNGVIGDIMSLTARASTGRAAVENFWPVFPTRSSRDISGEVVIPLDDTSLAVATEFIRIRQTTQLLRDTLKVDYIVTNDTPSRRNIGLRVFFDTRFGGNSLDGTRIHLSDGTIVTTESVFPNTDNPALPDGWVSFDDETHPGVVLRGTITGGEENDPGTSDGAAGPPDQVEFGLASSMGQDNQFDFTPNAAAVITGEDWGYATRWDEKPFAAGESRRFVTYVGLGGSASDFNPPYVLAAYSPWQLYFTEGDDPSTPTVVEDSYLADADGNGAWLVRAYCDNFGTASMTNARVTLSLPLGLELDTVGGAQSRTVALGSIPRNAQVRAEWRVRATEDVQPGIAEIRVTGPLGRTVTRKISIPATPRIPQANLDPNLGISMVSVPYLFQSSDAESVLTSLGSLETNDAALIRWSTRDGVYKVFPDPFITNIEPGLGFWLINRLRTPITLPAPPDRSNVPVTDSFAVDIAKGWNQIGSPFPAALRWDRTTVVTQSGSRQTLAEAAQSGVLRTTLYAYDPTLNEYTFGTSLADTVVQPLQGYWVYSAQNCTLLFDPPTLIPFAATAPAAAAPPQDADGWEASLLIGGPGVPRRTRTFGVARAAAERADLRDVLAPPPAMSNGVRLAAVFSHPDWGPDSGSYYVDIRSDKQAKHEWDLVVDTDLTKGPVSVTWPDLSAMPTNLTATLEDPAAGRTVFMRTAGGYTYEPQAGVSRTLRLKVEPRRAGPTVTAFNWTQQGAAMQLCFTLASEAAVDIVVRNIAGIPIAHVCEGQTEAAGEIVVPWRTTNDRGVPVPAGRYLVDLTARSPETGERMSVVRPVTVAR